MTPQKIGVYCASSNHMRPVFYEQARSLGTWLGQHGKTLVYGGNACGLMEALSQATKSAGGTVFGVVPRKLIETGDVSDTIDITFHCDDLHDRKQWLLDEPDAIVVMPGSVGTLDEAFSAMAAKTFGMHDKRIVFWNIDGFYDRLFAFLDGLTDEGVVNTPWGEVMDRANTLDELTALLS